MDVNQIATKEDVAQATSQIIAFVKRLVQDLKPETTTGKYLRSRDVKKMFGVSDNKLKDMRLNGEVPFIKKGATFYYPEEEIIKSMNAGLNPIQP